MNAKSVIRAGNRARSVEIIVKYRSLSAHEMADDRVVSLLSASPAESVVSGGSMSDSRQFWSARAGIVEA